MEAKKSVGKVPGLKSKDLVMMPARVAMALQADGWWVRSEIIWHKPAPMPESCRDRPMCAHEKVFLLAPAARYFYDAHAVREPDGGKPSGNGFVRPHRLSYGGRGQVRQWEPGAGRNLRNVWTINSQHYPEAHFATFPPRLAEICILAGTSEKGCCPSCGAPYVRQVEPTEEYAKLLGRDWSDPEADQKEGRGHFATGNGQSTQRPVKRNRAMGTLASGKFSSASLGAVPQVTASYRTVGWQPSCACPPADPVPCVVLDPFAGSGTTGAVAAQLGRGFVGVELNPAYVAMARERIETARQLADDSAAAARLGLSVRNYRAGQLALFGEVGL